MNIIYVILGVLLGLRLGFMTVCIILESTDSSLYSNKFRLFMSLLGFIVIFSLTTWLFVNALTLMFGV